MSDWKKTPEDILNAIKKAEVGVEALQRLANAEKLDREFTLDGRLVGDIGELIVARHFDVLEEKPKGHAHDLLAHINGKKLGVQVKLRRKTTRSGKIEFRRKPDILIVIQMSENWGEWRIVYHGSGDILFKIGAKCVLPITANNEGRFMQGNSKADLKATFEDLEKNSCRSYSQHRMKSKP